MGLKGAAWLLWAACGLALADAGPAPAPVVERISVQDGRASREAQHGDCGDLRLDARRVRHFLRHAVVSGELNYRRDALVGSCTAKATLHLKGGATEELAIDNDTGWAIAARRGGPTRYLYCESCDGLLEPGFSFKEGSRP